MISQCWLNDDDDDGSGWSIASYAGSYWLMVHDEHFRLVDVADHWSDKNSNHQWSWTS